MNLFGTVTSSSFTGFATNDDLTISLDLDNFISPNLSNTFFDSIIGFDVSVNGSSIFSGIPDVNSSVRFGRNSSAETFQALFAFPENGPGTSVVFLNIILASADGNVYSSILPDSIDVAAPFVVSALSTDEFEDLSEGLLQTFAPSSRVVSFDINSASFTPSTVPVPAALPLMASVLSIGAFMAWRRRRP